MKSIAGLNQSIKQQKTSQNDLLNAQMKAITERKYHKKRS